MSVCTEFGVKPEILHPVHHGDLVHGFDRTAPRYTLGMWMCHVAFDYLYQFMEFSSEGNLQEKWN